MSLEDEPSVGGFYDLRPRKRYYNVTYNSRHGKRRNLDASSYIKQLEEATRQKERVNISGFIA